MSKGSVVAGVVIGVVVLLVGGAFLADRVVESAVEKRAVDAIEQNLDGVVGTPQIEIAGFPFLTQVLRGSLDGVTGHVDGVTIEGIPATDVAIVATDVTTAEPYTAGTATIAATLPAASIDSVIAKQTTYDITTTVQGGTLKASGTLLGVTLSADLVPRVENGTLLVDVRSLAIGGVAVSVDSLPSAVASRLTNIEIPVQGGLPQGLTLSAVAVVDDGVRITATGTDVVVPTQAP